MDNLIFCAKSKCQYQVGLESLLEKIYLDILEDDPKPQDMSKSSYILHISIQVLDKLGNPSPTQEEIDAIEVILKRYSNRKAMRPYFETACRIIQ